MLDQRLNAALRRLPQYTSSILSAVRTKQMELKRIRLHRLLEWVKAKQSVKEGNSNENVSLSIDGKCNVYNGNLLDREASRDLYKRRMEEEKSKVEFCPL